ncbi:hypothetical protein OK016_08520 [Vibrio chagasii]|nr:hypothetical protein [Vibrio chagasii]
MLKAIEARRYGVRNNAILQRQRYSGERRDRETARLVELHVKPEAIFESEHHRFLWPIVERGRTK